VAREQLSSETERITPIKTAVLSARMLGEAWSRECIGPRGFCRTWLLLVCMIGMVAVQAWSDMAVLGDANHDAGRVPSDWQVREHSGKAHVAGCSDNEGVCVHLTSLHSSFSLERSVEVNLAELPYLSWSWKVTRLPLGGDFRKTSTDDQAAQLLVAFSDHRVLSYIWDSNAPKGAMQSANANPLVHVVVVVCESGAAETSRWVNETRNVAFDYERAFGKPASRIKGLRLQINTQHTGSSAESYFGRIAFRSSPD
jgi:Protein of unknown function (DUF3047)